MAKFEKTSDYIEDEIRSLFMNTGLDNFIYLTIISKNKAKTVFDISKADSITEYMINQTDVLRLVVYEEAYELLGKEKRDILLKAMFANIDYDTEKEKLILNKNILDGLVALRNEYSDKDLLDAYEASRLIIQQIEDKANAAKEQRKKKDTDSEV